MRIPRWAKWALGAAVVLSVMSTGRRANAAQLYAAKSWSFRTKLDDVAGRLGVPPLHLAAVIFFESGFSARAKNPYTGARGLIQFMKPTAEGLGTTWEALDGMTDVAQLDYVEKFLAPHAGKLGTLQDLYMAILWPRAIGQSADYPLFVAPSKAYQQNRGLDVDGDGVVTAGDATVPIARALRELEAGVPPRVTG